MSSSDFDRHAKRTRYGQDWHADAPSYNAVPLSTSNPRNHLPQPLAVNAEWRARFKTLYNKSFPPVVREDSEQPTIVAAARISSEVELSGSDKLTLPLPPALVFPAVETTSTASQFQSASPDTSGSTPSLTFTADRENSLSTATTTAIATPVSIPAVDVNRNMECVVSAPVKDVVGRAGDVVFGPDFFFRHSTWFQNTQADSTSSGLSQLQMLRGPALEVVVGSEHGTSIGASPPARWFLPKSLVSNHSVLLKEECLRPFQNDHEAPFSLPKGDPRVFELFVEWMYYGTYTALFTDEYAGRYPQFATTGATVSIHAKAWVLGATLRSLNFKNYAMRRLYESVMGTQARPIRPEDVKFACADGTNGSKLRQFFLDYAAAHSTDPSRMKGTVSEWDQVILEHQDLRESLLLRAFRSVPNQGQIVKDMEAYMETKQEVQPASLKVQSENTIIPAKRNAGGAWVKQRPATAH